MQITSQYFFSVTKADYVTSNPYTVRIYARIKKSRRLMSTFYAPSEELATSIGESFVKKAAALYRNPFAN